MRHRGLGDVSELKPPGYYVTGNTGPGVEVPGRVAAWLEARTDLRRIRTDARGTDPEVDAVLSDLHRVALLWRSRVEALPCSGSEQAGPRVAAILSVVESCRRLKVPVRDYLADILPGLANTSIRRIANLTPSAWAENHR